MGVFHAFPNDMNPVHSMANTDQHSVPVSGNTTELQRPGSQEHERDLDINSSPAQQSAEVVSSSSETESILQSVPASMHSLQLQGETPMPSRMRRYDSNIALLFVALVLSIFVFYYSYEALINPRPKLGKLFFSAPATVFVINVLSQGEAFIMARLYASMFEAVRWSFASRRAGVSLATFLGLSSSTSLFGIFRLLLAKGHHQFWCTQRSAIP